jgi:hypothetical protein
MKKKFIITAALLILSLNIYSQTETKPAGNTPAVSAYDQLLAKLKAGDTGIDYKALRISYTETKEYSSFGVDPEERSKLFKALDEKKYKEAIALAEGILKTNYVEMNAHFVSFVAYRELGDAKKSQYHTAVFSGLINSILNGADGKGAKTAYVVICVPEEYVIVNYLNYRRGGQALAEEDGHRFDILSVTDDRNKPVKLYFNIDIVWKGYEKMFSK